jgi:hypothetical protein
MRKHIVCIRSILYKGKITGNLWGHNNAEGNRNRNAENWERTELIRSTACIFPPKMKHTMC